MRICPSCGTREGVHGGCDCGFLSAWSPGSEVKRVSSVESLSYLNTILLTCPSGWPLQLSGPVVINEDGSYSFTVSNEDGSVTLRHTIKTEEM